MDLLRKLMSGSQPYAAVFPLACKDFPLDILMCIVDFLPPESAVALSLTCQRLKDVLGPRYLKELSSSDEDTVAVLKLLAIDLPNHIACAPCKRLHSLEKMQKYTGLTYGSGSVDSHPPPPCVYEDWENSIGVITELFGTTGFKMAIKRYHQESKSTELLDNMSCKTIMTMQRYDEVHQKREESRIVNGHLLHRLQTVRITRSTSPAFKCNLWREVICPHLRSRRDIHSPDLGVQKCQRCRTEFRIDFKYYDGHGCAIFFTRWKDLGPGPDDEIWSQQVAGLHGPRCYDESQGSSPGGEISSAFGDGGSYVFDEILTPENKAELFRLQERRIVWLAEYKKANGIEN